MQNETISERLMLMIKERSEREDKIMNIILIVSAASLIVSSVCTIIIAFK